MPPYRTSPIDNFLNRFLQGLQVYQSFQELENKRQQTGIQQQHQNLLQRQFDEAQRQQDMFRNAREQYIGSLPKIQTVDIPGATPSFTGEGPLGPRLSPELAMPPSTIERPRQMSPDEIGMATTLGKGDLGTYEKFVAGSRKMQPPQIYNDPVVGPFVVGPDGKPTFSPLRQEDKGLTPAEQRYFTPGSVAAYLSTKDRSLLQPIGKEPVEADKERDILAQDIVGADGRPLYKTFAELQEKDPKAAAEVERKRKAASALVVRETPPAERRLNRVDAPFVVDANGNTLPLNKILGKQLSQIPEAVAVLSATELPALKAAQRVVRIGDELKTLAPQILKKYGGTSLGQIFKVVGNKIYLTEIAQRAGDPNVIKFQTLLNGFLISEPQALGIPGGRESVRLLELVAKGAPTFGSTIEGLNSAIDTTIQTDIAPAWEARNINISGGSKKPGLPPGWEVVK